MYVVVNSKKQRILPGSNISALTLNSNFTANNNTNTTVLDNSSNRLTITATGNVYQGSFGPFTQIDAIKTSNQTSVYFNNNSYLQVTNNAALDLSSGNFTIEFWAYPINYGTLGNGVTNGVILSKWFSTGGYSFQVGLNSSGLLYMNWNNTTGFSSDTIVPINEWSHIAIVRNGNNFKMYKNGINFGSTTSSVTINTSTSNMQIGFNQESAMWYYGGYLTNLRILKGTALYNTDFTPQTVPLTAITNTSILALQGITYSDSSSNNLSISTGGSMALTNEVPFTINKNGSMYFDGSSYVSATSNAAFGLGISNFTIEAFVYPTNNPANGPGTICDLRSGSTASATVFRINNSLRLVFYDGPANSTKTFTSLTVAMNIWQHIAIVRNGNTITGYINGQFAGSDSVTSNLGTTQPCRVGGNQTAGFNFNGYITSLRIVKSAVYTSTFTAPTQLLTNITNTSILLKFLNYGINDITGKNNLAILGTTSNLKITNSVTTNGSASIIFSGSSYLYAIPNSSFSVGTGDFTIELWVRFITVPPSSDFTSFCQNDSIGSSTNDKFWFGYTNGTGLVFGRHNSGNTVASATWLPLTTLWYHVAVCRKNGTILLFLNGSQRTVTNSTVFNGISFGQNGMTIGAMSTPKYFNGYINNFRFIPGYAMYNSTFTPLGNF
jgi:hypothetical protein